MLVLSVGPRKVDRVIYNPGGGVAHIVCPPTRPTDPAPQIEKLIATGFVEVGRAV